MINISNKACQYWNTDYLVGWYLRGLIFH